MNYTISDDSIILIFQFLNFPIFIRTLLSIFTLVFFVLDGGRRGFRCVDERKGGGERGRGRKEKGRRG